MMCEIHEINCKQINIYIRWFISPQYITGNHDDTPLSPIGKRTSEELLLEAIPTIPEGSL